MCRGWRSSTWATSSSRCPRAVARPRTRTATSGSWSTTATWSAPRCSRPGIEPHGNLRFTDPWGNTIEVVEYGDVQFTKAPEVLRGMGLEGLTKTEDARAELAEKGLAG